LGEEFEVFLENMEAQMCDGINEEEMDIFFTVIERMRLNLEKEF